MLRLIIVRHAESEWNPVGRYQGILDPDLTERGRKQADLLGRELRKLSIDVLYTSPLRRTYETARIVGQHIGLKPVVDERVREIDHGRWSGLLVEEVKEKFPEEFRIWIEEPHKAKFEGGESLQDVFNRVKGFLEEVRRKHWGQTVGIVSHTVPIRCMLCVLLEVDLSRFWAFGCDNASYSVVDLEEGRAVLKELNVTCHLGDLYVEGHFAL